MGHCLFELAFEEPRLLRGEGFLEQWDMGGTGPALLYRLLASKSLGHEVPVDEDHFIIGYVIGRR